MKKPSMLAIATVLAISAGLVNAASQVAPKAATSSLSSSVGIIAEGDAVAQAGDEIGAEQADTSEPAGDPQDSDQSEADTAPAASETTGK